MGVGVVWRVREFPTRCDAHGHARWLGQRGAEPCCVAADASALPRLVCDCDLVGREAVGADTMGSCALLLGLFGVMVVVAIQSLYLGGLPEWAYPGWMARRYYVATRVLASVSWARAR